METTRKLFQKIERHPKKITFIGIVIVILSCCFINFEQGKIISLIKLTPGIAIFALGIIILEKKGDYEN